jgi:prepilin-type N-terminal cleavage/methylation domain-containing protein
MVTRAHSDPLSQRARASGSREAWVARVRVSRFIEVSSIDRSLPAFTLIELMVAISVLAIVLVMIAGSFSAVAHSKTQGEDHLNIDREGRAILWQLSSELAGAIQTPLVPSHVMLLGQGQVRNHNPLDSITLSTIDAGHRRSITGYWAEDTVTYTPAQGGSRRGLATLSRSQSSSLGGGSSGSTVLADNVIALHIRYFDGNNWLESWDSSKLPIGGQLPIAVSIDLALASQTGRVMTFSTQVMVPMAVQVW